MGADFKTVWFLKFSSIVQKLLNVDRWRSPPLLHKNNVKSVIFQKSIIFEKLHLISIS